MRKQVLGRGGRRVLNSAQVIIKPGVFTVRKASDWPQLSSARQGQKNRFGRMARAI